MVCVTEKSVPTSFSSSFDRILGADPSKTSSPNSESTIDKQKLLSLYHQFAADKADGVFFSAFCEFLNKAMPEYKSGNKKPKRCLEQLNLFHIEQNKITLKYPAAA